MENFDKAFSILLTCEGGYSNDPNDSGGATKYGISQKSYPTLDIENLTIDQAKQIYLDNYWNPLQCDKLPYPVAALLFCEAVNMEGSGSKGVAVQLLQEAVGATQDGIMGQQTIGLTNAHQSATLCDLLGALFATRYTNLKEFPTYGKGWLTRLFKIQRQIFSDNGNT